MLFRLRKTVFDTAKDRLSQLKRASFGLQEGCFYCRGIAQTLPVERSIRRKTLEISMIKQTNDKTVVIFRIFRIFHATL